MTDSPVSSIHRRVPPGEGLALDPFGYFLEQASAIPGMGGRHASPDPRYCFHTPYEPRKAGQIRVVVRLGGVSVTFGQLTVRIHAFRPGVDLDVSLAAANRIDLDDAGDVIELSISALAIPDVHYAVYGYLSEPSDLGAATLDVLVFETQDEDPQSFVQPGELRTAFGASSDGQSGHLITAAEPDFASPASQPCSPGQLASGAYRAAWPGCFLDLPDEQARWCRKVALSALDSAGFLRPGARGLVVDERATELPAIIAEAGCQVIVAGVAETGSADAVGLPELERQLDKLAEGSRLDFAISVNLADRLPDQRAVAAHVQALNKCLLRGGAGVFLFHVQVPQSRPASARALTAGDISRLALSVLAHGSQVVQLNFAWNAGVKPVDSGRNAFILQTRR